MIEELLADAGLDYKSHGEHEHVCAGWLGLDCPLCTPDSQHYRLGVALDSGSCSCWVCGPQSFPYMLSLLTRQSTESWKVRLSGVWTHDFAKVEAAGSLVKPHGVGPMQGPHRRYLEGRRFDPDELEDVWAVQGIGMAPRLCWRLYVPVYVEEREVSWTTRALCDWTTRYVSARPSEEAMRHKDVLGGEDLTEGVVCAVEGPSDAWRVGPGAVWTFGAKVTNAQVWRLSRYARRLVCLDGEGEAQESARRVCGMLSGLPGETVNVVLESAKDPGGAAEWELKELRRMLR